MNRTEYIGKLNALYVGDKNCLEELITAYDEKDKEIERLKNGCKELEQQIDDLYKLETTLTNENERLNKALQDIKEYIRDEVAVFAFSEVGNMNLAHWEFNDDNVEHILDIVNKALGSDKE